MFVSMGAWLGPKPSPLLVYLTWLIGTLSGISQKLWPLILKLGFMCTHPVSLYKVASFYLFKALICMVRASLAHKDFSFLWFRATWYVQLVYYYFRGLSIFQTLRSSWLVDGPHHSQLVSLKVLSLTSSLDHLTFYMLILFLLGLSLTF